MTTHRQTGFSLLEMMIAVAITAAIMTIAAAFFVQAMEASERSQTVFTDVNNLETVWQVLATDVHHIIERGVAPPSAGIGSSTGALPSFLGGDPGGNSVSYLQGDYSLRFVREGWANPLRLVRSDMQRVGYRLVDGQLWRDYWAEYNQPYDADPIGTRLLAEGITAVRVRFLPGGAKNVAEGPWVDSWPPSQNVAGLQNSQRNLPVAFEITLEVEALGDIQRVFALPGI